MIISAIESLSPIFKGLVESSIKSCLFAFKEIRLLLQSVGMFALNQKPQGEDFERPLWGVCSQIKQKGVFFCIKHT